MCSCIEKNLALSLDRSVLPIAIEIGVEFGLVIIFSREVVGRTSPISDLIFVLMNICPSL